MRDSQFASSAQTKLNISKEEYQTRIELIIKKTLKLPQSEQRLILKEVLLRVDNANNNIIQLERELKVALASCL